MAKTTNMDPLNTPNGPQINTIQDSPSNKKKFGPKKSLGLGLLKKQKVEDKDSDYLELERQIDKLRIGPKNSSIFEGFFGFFKKK